MFKKFVLFSIILGVTISAYGAWDETKPADAATVAAGTTATRANFDAMNDVFGTMLDTGTAVTATAAELNTGVRLPSGAVFFMLTGSCPTGTTDVTSTYSGRFVKAGTSQGTTAGPTLTGTTASHTLTIAQIPAHTHQSRVTTSGVGGTNYTPHDTGLNGAIATGSAGGGGGHTHNLSGATTLEPKSVQCRWCSVD